MSGHISVGQTLSDRTSVAIREVLGGRRRGLRHSFLFAGPAIIASIAYMDPGNFATNIQAGAKYGYTLLWVVLMANLIAMLFQALSAKLGIVTGRPRSDAVRFLEEQCVADLFSTVVCMEDAPSKPDPAPVALALKETGASSAWMVGDSPDDIRSACGAGVVPIGVLAAGDDHETAEAGLKAAGAARVLDDPSQIEEVLP